MKSTRLIMILKMQIPDLKKAQESLSQPTPQEEVVRPKKSDGCSLIGSRKSGTQEKGKRCLSKKGRAPLMKPKLQGPREKGRCALLELHTQHPESKKAVSLGKDGKALVSQWLQGCVP